MKLSHDTKLTMPMSFAIAVLAGVFTSVVWMKSVEADASATTYRVQQLEAIVEMLPEIRDRLARTEAKVDFLVKVEGMGKSK